MDRFRFRDTALPIASGFGLRYVSHDLEQIGDLHAVMRHSADALTYHLAALLCLLGAFACFIFAGVKLVRYFRGGDDRAPPPPPPAPPSRGRESVEADDEAFDPDAIMARYLAGRQATPPPPPAPRPAGRGFGRKAT